MTAVRLIPARASKLFPMGTAKWTFSGANVRCLLLRHIPQHLRSSSTEADVFGIPPHENSRTKA